jgi:predicted small integral membrane protein
MRTQLEELKYAAIGFLIAAIIMWAGMGVWENAQITNEQEIGAGHYKQ